jgi:mRNA-decapping enzyme subunit 2
MPPKLRAPENVWTYPRPARAERTAARLRVVWTDAQGTETTLADTTDGYRVLETSHPPTVSRAAWLCRRHRL